MSDLAVLLIKYAQANVEPGMFDTLDDSELLALGKAVQAERQSPAVLKALEWVKAACEARGLV